MENINEMGEINNKMHILKFLQHKIQKNYGKIEKNVKDLIL